MASKPLTDDQIREIINRRQWEKFIRSKPIHFNCRCKVVKIEQNEEIKPD